MIDDGGVVDILHQLAVVVDDRHAAALLIQLPGFDDGLGMGIGFTIALVLMGSIREIIGNGSWFGMVLNDGSLIQPMLILILPPGGFFVFGMLIALFNRLAEGKGKEPATLSCCNCPQAASCMKASEGGCE